MRRWGLCFLASTFLCTIILLTYKSSTGRRLPLQHEALKDSIEPNDDDDKTFVSAPIFHNDSSTAPVQPAASTSSLPSSSSSTPSSTSSNKNGLSPSEIAAAELTFLEESLSTPLDIADLAGMGVRIASFAKVLQAVQADPSVDKLTALDLFEKHFPWWQAHYLTYQPWFSNPTPTAEADSSSIEPEPTGIVMCVDNDNVDQAAHALLTLLVVHGTQLQIDVAYAGDENLSVEKRAILQELVPQLEFLDVADHFDEDFAGVTSGVGTLKPFAALASRSGRVVAIDPDVIFFNRPDFYFDEHGGLNKTGLLYFHDRAVKEAKSDASDRVGKLLKGQAPSKALEETLFWREKLQRNQDAGVVFIDKSNPTAFMSLVFTAYMNAKEVYSLALEPDFRDATSETFWLASELSNAPYTFAPSHSGLLGYDETDSTKTAYSSLDSSNPQRICSHQTLHLGLHDKPFWINSGLRLKKTAYQLKMLNGEEQQAQKPELSERAPAEEEEDANDLSNQQQQAPSPPPATDVVAEELHDFATFTHWVRNPSTSLADQPTWSNGENGRLCVEVTGKVERLPVVVRGLLHNLFAEARRGSENLQDAMNAFIWE